MLQQLLDDLRGYFEAKSSLTTQEQELWNRLKKADYPILDLQDDDLAQKGFDFRRITDEQMRQLARQMTADYCKEDYWERLENTADELQLPRYPRCPACGHNGVVLDETKGVMHCEICDQTWHEDLYVLAEFPDDTTYFEENDIGYPSFGSEDNGASTIITNTLCAGVRLYPAIRARSAGQRLLQAHAVARIAAVPVPRRTARIDRRAL